MVIILEITVKSRARVERPQKSPGGAGPGGVKRVFGHEKAAPVGGWGCWGWSGAQMGLESPETRINVGSGGGDLLGAGN